MPELAKRRSVRYKGTEIITTPLLLPSFSSKGFPYVDKIIKTCEEFISEEILVSCYDLYYGKIQAPFTFPSCIFLDSGGYEASKEQELSDVGDKPHKPNKWDRKKHEEVLATWPEDVPTIYISYDNPQERVAIPLQIERALEMAKKRPGLLREILIKPESPDSTYIKIESLLDNVPSLHPFAVIGVTEKEIGRSFQERMENIARLRRELMKRGMETPIHIFGSLDTISSPLYFVAGADIFDGLTWLRYAYYNGNTIYRQNYGALALGLGTRAEIVEGQCWSNNYHYLMKLRDQMRAYINTGDFSVFAHHSTTIQNAYKAISPTVGV